MIHRLSVRVYWEDTDAGGIVYHSNYLKFAERGRTELVRNLGIDQSQLAKGPSGCAFAVRRCEIDFLRPARLDDLLLVHTEISAVGGASLDMRQWIERDCAQTEHENQILARLFVNLAFIGLENGKPVRIPSPLKSAVMGMVQKG